MQHLTLTEPWLSSLAELQKDPLARAPEAEECLLHIAIKMRVANLYLLHVCPAQIQGLRLDTRTSINGRLYVVNSSLHEQPALMDDIWLDELILPAWYCSSD